MNEHMFWLLGICFGLCTCITQLRMMIGIKEIFRMKENRIVNGSYTLLVASISTTSILLIKNLPAIYVILFLLLVILNQKQLRLNLVQSSLLACFYIFHVIVLKGIAIGCISLLYKKNGFVILSDAMISISTEITVQFLLFLILILYQKKIMKIKNVRNFLVCKKQLILVLSCHLTITTFLLFNSFSFYYNLDLVWISISQIMVGLIMYAVYMIILNYGIHVADLLQHKIRNKNQMEIIKQQVMKQNSLSKMEKVLNQFKHDYREQILSVEYCIENNLKEEALVELKKDCLHILNNLPSSKNYSNNFLLNSLLIDQQSQCQELQITMEAKLYIPANIWIGEKQCHEIIRILFQNAIDGNKNVIEKKRYIHMKSSVDNMWLSIMIENPYEGVIHFENNRPVPSRFKEDHEGLGLIFVEEVLSEVNGFIRYEINSNTNIFRVIVLIPLIEK